jgi:hypothetical protein
MLSIPRYNYLVLISESPNSLIFRTHRQQDEPSVVLMLLREDYPSPSELVRYRQALK